MKTKMKNCCVHTAGLGPSSAYSLVVTSVSMSFSREAYCSSLHAVAWQYALQMVQEPVHTMSATHRLNYHYGSTENFPKFLTKWGNLGP